jgi:hypothetical protein
VEALTRFNGAVDKAATRTKKIIEDRRKSQNVESYYGVPTAPQRSGALGTAGNPIRLD